MKEEWLTPGAVVPVDIETTAALVGEVKRMMHIIGGMALNQKHPWVGLTDGDVYPLANEHLRYQPEDYEASGVYDLARAIEAKLKEKNT